MHFLQTRTSLYSNNPNHGKMRWLSCNPARGKQLRTEFRSVNVDHRRSWDKYTRRSKRSLIAWAVEFYMKKLLWMDLDRSSIDLPIDQLGAFLSVAID